MRFYLGTHEPSWIGRSPLPLFVSLERRGRFGRRAANAGWALDSGGFTQTTHRGGWTQPTEAFVDEVRQLAERVPGLEWSAPQDWMCEPAALHATGLTVDDHQARTVDNFLQLRAIAPDFPFIPVLQGWKPGEHEACAERYASAGVDLTLEPLVGVGTICRRQDTAEIAAIVRSLASAGYRLHGFGVKTGGLARYGHLLESADSLAWSYRAVKAARHGEGPLGDGCTHRACGNCYRFAHQWADRLADLTNQPLAQMELFP